MKLLSYFKENKYFIIFTLFVIFYMFYYGPFGYNDADDGFTIASSWRILNGEIPYRDFILVRPPLSPLFHALPLYLIPANYQMIFDRFFFYILMALSSLFGAFTIDSAFRLHKLNFDTYLLATLGFVFSVNHFPPMAWHTVDGVFFASIGIYILVRFSSLYSIFFGLLFLFLSSLCKQSFYLLPLTGVIYVFIIYKDWGKTICSILSLLLFIGIFFLILYEQGTVTYFITMTSGSTKFRDLLSAGFIKYFNFNSIYLILPFGFWIFVRKFPYIKLLSGKEYLVPYLFISILIFLPLAKFIYFLLYKDTIYSTFYHDDISHLLFITTILYLFSNLSLDKKWITLWFLTLVSWSASISWGYQNPALFSVPLIFAFLLVANQHFEVKKITNLAFYFLLIGTIMYLLAYQKPYCNPMRRELTHEISYLFPKLKFIRVGEETYRKYNEFASLVSKYGNNFKTLPGMPLANYLTNTNSPIKIDWVLNGEINGENNLIIDSLTSKKTVIFMEKDPQLINVSNSNGKFNSSVSYFIKNNWKKVESTIYFEVYEIE